MYLVLKIPIKLTNAINYYPYNCLASICITRVFKLCYTHLLLDSFFKCLILILDDYDIDMRI